MGSATRRNDELVIGLIGLGSIGTRHALKLKELGVKKIVCLRTNAGAKKEIDPQLQSIVQIFSSEKEFRDQKPNALIISNPTALHANALEQFADLNIPVFVEKPMISESSEANQLTKLQKDLIFVGYCLRYHSIIQTVQKLIKEQTVGKIFLAKLAAGHYLPDWHPYTDYTKEYYSRKDLGGGALRTLSHEIDLMVHFFGTPNKRNVTAGKLSDLKIDVDDYALLQADYGDCHVRVELDFISLDSTRTGSFYGDGGEIHFDFGAALVYVIDRKTKEKRIIEYDVKQDMYLEQMKAFLNFVNTRTQSLFCTFDEAYVISNIIDQTKKMNDGF